MKLGCSVCVGNRLLPALAINPKRQHVKSTLALCKKPKTEEFCIILFTGQNKNGTKYNLKENISQILTRFINDGKATIQFKNPPHDLYLQADVIQLKGFLHLLKRALENKISSNELTYSSMSVTPIAAKDIAPIKLVINKRSDYPSKGFPRTLEILYINDVKRFSLDRGILQLTKLKVLNLCNNCIEYLPEELNKLPNLRELNVAGNNLQKSTLKQWSWVGGNLSKTLIFLSLESNNLTYLPEQIVKLHNLETLQVSHNQIKALPLGIGNLRNLKVLKASYNLITILPGSIKKCQLEWVDLSNNKFYQSPQNNPSFVSPKTMPVCSLKEYAGRKILNLRLLYSSEIIPATLVHYLDYAKYCVCGKACFDVFIRDPRAIFISSFAKVFANDFSTFVPIDCYFCSLSCYRSLSSRIRYPVIR